MTIIVESCCCGCSLKTGSRVIGIIFTLMSLILMSVSLVLSEDEEAKKDDVFRIVMIIMACTFGLEAFFAILLVIGALREIRCLLKTWVIYECIIMSLCIMDLVKSIFGGADITSILIAAVTIPLRAYSIVVVNSHHKSLTEPNPVCQFQAGTGAAYVNVPQEPNPHKMV